jgi:hypothetical protein
MLAWKFPQHAQTIETDLQESLKNKVVRNSIVLATFRAI